MTDRSSPGRGAGRGASEIRVALVAALLMLALPLAAKLGAPLGAPLSRNLAERGHLVILAAFLVMTGNSIPKRLAPLACRGADAAGLQAFQRFAGWVWVITGIVWGAVCALFPAAWSTTATFVIMPTAILMIAARWLALRTPQPPTH
jgi:hypothetical protein